MIIDIRTFGGILPSTGRHLLTSDGAAEAINCRLGSGELRPLARMRKDHGLPASGSMYRHRGTWLHYADIGRRFVPGPVYTDDQRLYMSKASGGAVVYTAATGENVLGVKEPTATPSVAVSGSAADNPSKLSRVYTYTLVSSLGEEGPPSPASGVVTLQTGQSVLIGNLLTPPHEGYLPISLKRIYRSATGNEATDFLLVAEIPASQTEFIDNIDDSLLGEALSSVGWRESPADLKGLCSLPGGILAGFSGQEVRLCEPNMPHAWPDAYAYTVEYPIVQLAASERTLFILTSGPVYAMQLDDITAAVPIRLEGETPCFSARGVIETPTGVVFPSRDGLYLVAYGMSNPQLLTGSYYQEPEWLNLNPASMFGCWCAGSLYIFCTTKSEAHKGIILSQGNIMTTTDVAVDDVTVATDGERMFVASDGICWEWEGDKSTNLFATWRSKSFLLSNPTNFAAALIEASIEDDLGELEENLLILFNNYLESANRVIYGGTGMLACGEVAFASDAYHPLVINALGDISAVTVDFFANGKCIYSKQVLNREPFSLPCGFTARTWYVRAITNRPIKRIALAEAMSELYS